MSWQRIKPAIVGEAPSKQHGHFGGPSARQLSESAGLGGGVHLLKHAFDTFNLFDLPQRKVGKGNAFPIEEARTRAAELSRALCGRKVVLLGGRVARAFGIAAEFDLAWREVVLGQCTFSAAVLPHPSGINAWWNHSENRKAAEALLMGVQIAI